jgi:hypothetical protein
MSPGSRWISPLDLFPAIDDARVPRGDQLARRILVEGHAIGADIPQGGDVRNSGDRSSLAGYARLH